MAGHDIYFVESEAKAKVQEHVEGCPAEGKPEQSAAASAPDAGEEEQCEECFDDVLHGRAVGDDDGTVAQDVAQGVVSVQLYGLAEEVFDDGTAARRGDVGPPHETALGNGSPVGIAAGLGLSRAHGVEAMLGLGQQGCVGSGLGLCYLHLEGALGFRLAPCGSLRLAFLFGSLLGMGYLLLRQHEVLVFHAGNGPEQGRGEEEGEEYETHPPAPPVKEGSRYPCRLCFHFI